MNGKLQLNLHWNPFGGKLSAALLAAGLLFVVPVSRAADDEAAAKVEWLRALAVQARLACQFDPQPDPELFRETTADGRTQLEFIADSLGAGTQAAEPGRWVLLNEAASICLNEADNMKTLAAGAAGSPKEAVYNTARLHYLLGAARILGYAATASGSTFDTGTAGDPGTGVDWSLSDQLILREVAGEARLNVKTSAFSGRLSAMLELPGLGAALSVRNFSFDSAGNMDLTAYGSTSFPEGSTNAVTLLVPPRRPLSMHLGTNGTLSAAGALDVGFPGGNKVDAYFDIDDPKYQFGLSFDGRATIDMANKVSVMLPTVDTNSVLSPAAIDGLAQFFGAFGRGVETFLDAAPDLPSPAELDVGTPPDFQTPELSIPFDVLDAWLVSLANDEVRPRINGSVSDALGEVHEMFAGLSGAIAAARSEVEPTLAQIKQLNRLAKANAKLGETLKNGRDQLDAGHQEEADQLLAEAGNTAEEARDIAREYFDNLSTNTTSRRGIAALSLLLDNDKTATFFGKGSLLSDQDFLDSLSSKFDQWSANTLQPYGFAIDGTIINSNRVSALSPEDLSMLLHYAINMDKVKAAFGGDGSLPTPVMATIVKVDLANTRAHYEKAVAAHDNAARAVCAVRIAALGGAAHSLGMNGEEVSSALGMEEIVETRKAIQGAADTPDSRRSADKVIEAARRVFEASNRAGRRRFDDLVGATPGDNPLPEDAEFSFLRQPLFERWYRSITAAVSAGAISPENLAAVKADLASFMKYFVQFQTEHFSDGSEVEQNLEEVEAALVSMADFIAMAEDMFPDDVELLGTLQQNWQALHITFTGVAEAQHMHWLLAAYARELAAATTRYGDGLSGALLTAFETAGTEAVAGLSQVAAYLGGIVTNLDTQAYTFALPGDIEVRRLRGNLIFDRSLGSWNFGFGGRLVFPDINGIFEVSSGTLSSDGAFSLAMLASSDTAFGLADDFSLAMAVPDFTGNLFNPRLDSFAADGTLVHHLGGIPPEDESYNVHVDYDWLNPGHRFAVRTSFSGKSELFSPDIMLFSGGFGFNLETDGSGQPTQGGAAVQASLGLLLRPEAASVAPTNRTPANYYLTFTGDSEVDFPANSRQVRVTLKSGTLTLPPDIFSGPNGLAASVVLSTPVCASIDLDDPTLISWCDTDGHPVRIAFNNIGFTIPGVPGSSTTNAVSDPAMLPAPETIPNFQAGVSAVLLLSGDAFPVIEKINASIDFPMPGVSPTNEHRMVQLDIAGTDWRIDGLPGSVSLALGSDLTVADTGGFSLALLQGSGFGLEKFETNSEERVRFTATGNVLGKINQDILSDTNGNDFAFSAAAGGSFSWDFVDPPALTLNTLKFSGAMNLGGVNGVQLAGVDANGIPDENGSASIELLGLTYLFSHTPEHPFEIKVNGSINALDTLWFGMQDARIVFDGIDNPPDNTEPQFIVSAFGFREDKSTVKLLGLDALPARLTAGSISFRNPNLGFPDLLAVTNLKFVVSGMVDIRLGEGDSTELPRLYGDFEGARISFPNGFEGLPEFGINSLTLALENLTIGDMGGLTGGLAVGNIDDPDNLFFAGEVGGSFNGVKIKAIVATRLDGLIGLCLSANGGPAGIPLDGGMLGGILLTGATGGVYFGNHFANPCSFKDILNLSSTGEPPASAPQSAPQPARAAVFPEPDVADLPVLTWSEIDEYNRQREILANWESTLQRQAAGDDSCPTSPCPANSVGLLAQLHPSTGEEPSAENYNTNYANTVIYKFTSMDRRTVDDLLVSAGIDTNASNQTLSEDFSAAATNQIHEFIYAIPHPPEFEVTIDETIGLIYTNLQAIVLAGLDAASGKGQTAIEALHEAAYAGVPSQDITILLDGTLTWAPVSAVLSLTGGATASTTGSAGIFGRLNLVGLPVGTGEFYYSITDSNGDPNPSFCGGARAAVGPLRLGRMKMAYECPGCINGVFEALGNFITDMDSTLAGQVDPILRQYIADALDTDITNVTASLDTYFGPSGSLTNEHQIAVLASMLNIPQCIASGAACPFDPDAFSALGDATVDLLINIYSSINPDFIFCGDVEPKLFGFSLTGGNSLVAANLHATKTNFEGSVAFSPSYVFGNLPFSLISGGAVRIVPALDQATMGIAMNAPTIDTNTFVQMKTDPGAYVSGQLESILSDAALTFGYELKPFGMKLADGEGRVMLPSILNHPDNPANPPFEPPALPDRETVLDAALASNVLAEATWKGKDGDLANLFPEGSAERGGATGLELARDYFPRGGFIGAAHLELPKLLAELPPSDDINQLVDANSTISERFDAAQTIGNDYLLATEPAGDLTMYVPFPSPPAAFWTGTQDPEEFIAQISALDYDALIGNPGAGFTEDFFMKGQMTLKLFGVEFNESELIADPSAGVFRYSSSVPADSWLHNFVQGGVTIEILPATYLAEDHGDESSESLQPEARLLAAFEAVTNAVTDLEKDSAAQLLTERITDTLPRASFAAAFGADLNAAIAEAGLTNFFRFNGGVWFYAFSPRFEPGYATNGYTGTILYPDPDPSVPGPYTQARRNGGCVAIGDFDFGYDLNGSNPLVINIPEMQIGITGGTTNPLPNLAARAFIEEAQIADLPTFTNAVIVFNSNPPDDNTPIFSMDGTLESFSIQNILTFQGIGGGDLHGALDVTRNGTSLAIDPAEALLPSLGNVAVAVFGATESDPFSFSSVSGEAWSANIRIAAPGNPNGAPTFDLHNPLDPTGPVVASFSPTGPVSGTLSGNGLDSFALEAQIPKNFDITFFPGQPTESTAHIGGTENVTLYLDSAGRFYADFGNLSGIGLPGVLTAGGRLELGFNPGGDGPAVSVSTVPTFGTVDLGSSAVQQVTVTNSGNAAATMTLGVTPAADFSVAADGFTVAPGASQTVDLIFHPSSAGAHSGTLTLRSNDPANPTITRTLTGTGRAVPRYFQSRSSINFPLTVVGGVSKSSVTIANTGTAPLTISSVQLSDATSFSVSPAGGFTLAPGEQRLLTVSFQPNAETYLGSTLLIRNASLPYPYSIPLTGTGRPSQWSTVLDHTISGSAATLQDVKILDNGTGWAVGDDGDFYETRDFGHSWTPRNVASNRLSSITVHSAITSGIVAEYHFEEPNGTFLWRDDGPDGYHATTPSAGNRPLGGPAYGVLGGGLRFQGGSSNSDIDYLNLGTFDLPHNWAISMWINPDTTGTQCFLAKNTSSGGYQIVFGIYWGGYHLRFNGSQAFTPTGSAPTTGWQHLVLNARYDSGTDKTLIDLYRNGVAIWDNTQEFNGPIAPFGGGRPWTLGQKWNGNTAENPFRGEMDEVCFFGRTLSTTEITALADGTSGQTILVAGDQGTILRSATRGRSWQRIDDPSFSYAPGLDLLSHSYWRNWSQAVLTDDGHILAAGTKRYLKSYIDPDTPSLMLEDHYNGDQFGTIQAQHENGEGLTALTPRLRKGVSGEVYYAPSSLGHVLSSTNGLIGTWMRHDASLNLPGALNDIAGFSTDLYGTVPDYIAVGDGGAIIESANDAAPTRTNHGLTSEALRAIATEGYTSHTFHVVGDNGVYLQGSKSGTDATTWTLVSDGLTGNNYGVDAYGVTSPKHVIVVGEDNRIQQRQSGGAMLSFYPGELDFGSLPPGGSRTLPLHLHNGGAASIQINSISVSGTAFSLAQANIESLAPGESAVLQVRYNPASISAFDYGEVQFTVSTGGDPLCAELVGQCENAEWEPMAIHLPGDNVAADGKILDLAISGTGSSANLYALIETPTSSPRLLKLPGAQPDGKWEEMTLPVPEKGNQAYQLKSLDAINDSGSDTIAVSGTLLEDGSAISGALQVSTDSGSSWADKKPASSNSTEFLDVQLVGSDISVLSKEDDNDYARKWTAPIITPSWSYTDLSPELGKQMLSDKNFQALHFTNASTVDFAAADKSLLATADSGLSWSRALAVGPAVSLRAADSDANGGLVWTGGSVNGKAVAWVRKTATATARPILSVSDMEFFQSVAPGGCTTNSVTLSNIGNTSLPIRDLRIESDDPLCRFHLSGTAPTSISAGGSVSLPVIFDALPDPAEAAALNPAAYFRFEDAYGATTFLDDGPDHFTLSAPASSSAYPSITCAAAPRRGHVLEFDGNDYAEMAGLDSLSTNCSFSAWVRIDRDVNQAFFGKHNADGSRNLILAGHYYGGYYFAVNHQGYHESTPVQFGWQHIAVTCREVGSNTEVSFYRNGELLWNHVYTTRNSNLAGHPWVLGMDWDGGNKTDFLKGGIDDFAIFNRVLPPAEIRALASASPVCGRHRAALAINSGSESGQRTVDLHAEVDEASDLVVIDTVPSGHSITVDGIGRMTPFAVAVRCTASNPAEWTLGSLHRISAPAAFAVIDASGNQLEYQFESWNAGAGSEIVVAARPGMDDIVGTCTVTDIIPAAPPTEPASIPQKALYSEFDINAAMAGTPHGPFIRISNGSLAVNGLGSNQPFTLQGDLLAGFSELHARLSSSSLNVPESNPLFELGEASWKLDLDSSSFRLACNPPSVKLMGSDIAPDGRFSIDMNTGSETDLTASMVLESDFRPVPNFVEFKRGSVSASVSGSAWSFRFNGGMRILRLPDGMSQVWALDTSNAFAVNGDIENFSQSLGSFPVNSAPWYMNCGLTVTRTNGGSVGLAANISTLEFNNHTVPITPLSGTVTTDGELRLTGQGANGGTTILDFGGGVTLESASAADYALIFTSRPVPSLRLDIPSLRLKYSGNSDFPSGGITIPAVSLDSSGAFDTGRVPLSAFTFAGINVSRPSDGELANNYIRLSRNNSDGIVFNTCAQIPFMSGCTPDDFALTLKTSNGLKSTYHGYFCVLPEPVTLHYDSSAACPFNGSAFGFDIHFGSPSCTCVSAGGVTILGTCP